MLIIVLQSENMEIICLLIAAFLLQVSVSFPQGYHICIVSKLFKIKILEK